VWFADEALCGGLDVRPMRSDGACGVTELSEADLAGVAIIDRLDADLRAQLLALIDSDKA
jgi:hypothetical protein